jgi:hypothetical protein
MSGSFFVLAVWKAFTEQVYQQAEGERQSNSCPTQDEPEAWS